MIVQLQVIEQVIAQYVAAERNGTRRRAGTKDNAAGPDSVAIDSAGMLGEMAAAKLLNVYPDFELIAGQPPAHDLTLPDGRTVDVKSTPHAHGHLIVNPSKRRSDKRSDIYLLMIRGTEAWRCAGWLPAREVFDSVFLRDSDARGPAYWVPQGDLYPIEALGGSVDL